MANLRSCPRCGSVEIDWLEHASTCHFTQTAEGIDPEGYPSTPDPFKVAGSCRPCGHVWTARGALQIWDLPGHPDYDRNCGELVSPPEEE